MAQLWIGNFLHSSDTKPNHRYDADLFKFPSFVEQSQFVALLSANNSGGASSSVVYNGEEEECNVFVEKEADEEDWNLDGVITAAEPDDRVPRRRFSGLQTERRAVLTEVLAVLVDALQMA